MAVVIVLITIDAIIGLIFLLYKIN